jgi:hypothetical protein
VSEQSNPLEPMLREIVGALKADLYYLAILQALAIPDICGAVETKGGRGGPKQYKAWYEKYVWRSHILLDPSDCYSLRCGVVHQGQMLIPGKDYKNIVFVVPKWGAGLGLNLHMSDCGDTLTLNIINFCEAMDIGARKWFDDEKENPIVQENVPMLFRPRPSADPVLGKMVISSRDIHA